jgi:DDE superfamily endonuclease/Helix-turn-helix of DDE superfamily endonuclease
MYTGLHASAIQALASTLSTLNLRYYHGSRVTSVSLEDQVFLTLMKLRLNTPLLDLSVRFGVCEKTVSNIFKTILFALHKLLFSSCMCVVPSRSKCLNALPACFKPFPNCRQIWDCTEVSIEIPRGNLEAQRMTYSSYKSKNTFKGLVSIAPNGTIVFCSKLFSGNTSDKEIVLQSGVLETCVAGDMVMADKGFLIHDILPPGVTLNIPPFLDNQSRQFSEQQVLQTRLIARARIHVERAIQRAKQYNILNIIPSHYRDVASVIFQTCFALVNLQSPIVSVDESLMSSLAIPQNPAVPVAIPLNLTVTLDCTNEIDKLSQTGCTLSMSCHNEE